ncbi:uncharacterized protein SPAPADRAFT_64140 [Spathaspora passalidarum NRRL Y-27907]|uniref:TEA domain-containing protein n=1 Tax=Spathaspora passalidarum (strain NRRL Y-27907 / 11-Y1) TaxID=619300 RepID=G3AFE0_SPAPN|nr:uncharacterized protein SPAPADRAFT_64140 [Spathaspora passalidarum NRRL Y-27907]EGW34929.1 hypothetical protein SPAPADRAFT_64140 [Spathaspora passalidarum NRRL Y-27907]
MSNNDNSNPKSIMHPETPRASRNGAMSNSNRTSTPTFTFGLSFSPSFSFNSPVSVISPSKMINISNNLNRAFTKRQFDSTKETPNTKTRNRFLDSLTKAKSQSPLGIKLENEHMDMSSQSGDELWTTLDHNESHANITDMTTITNDNESKSTNHTQNFLTPQKLIIPNDKTIKKEITSSNLKPSLLSSKELETNRSDLELSSPEVSITRVNKRRKLETYIGDSPNNSVASQIETMDSPIIHRTPVNSARKEVISAASAVLASNVQSEDKVWYPELDDVLIKSFQKYREFRENQTGSNSSTVLKSTSQNKVLSRMILNKTGILRTSKQISSRLFRLSKSNRLDKRKKGNASSTNLSTLDEIEDLISTPLDQLMASSKESGVINEQELNALLSSSPPDDNSEENVLYSLSLNEISLSYKSKFNSLEDHIFAKFNSTSRNKKSTQTIESLRTRYNLDLKVLGKLHEQNLPVWLLEHDVNVTSCRSQLCTSTPMSASSDSHVQHPMNLMNGSFESLMKVSASSSESNKSFLSWNICSNVYKGNSGDCKLLEAADIINGYYDESTKSYLLQIPFMRSFLSGYISYLVNGASMITPEDDNLTIIQMIYSHHGQNSGKFDPENSTIRGYIIHQLEMGSADTKSVLTEISLSDEIDMSESLNNSSQTQIQAEDDNETVFVGSSPLKGSSPSTSQDFETPQRPLHIDINRANIDSVINPGPKSAPIIYTMPTFRKDLLVQGAPQGHNLQQNLAAINENPNQPQMLHSVSMQNIPQYKNQDMPIMPTNFNQGVTSYSASNTPYMNAQPTFGNQSTTAISQWDSDRYISQESYSRPNSNGPQDAYLLKQGQFNMPPSQASNQFLSQNMQPMQQTHISNGFNQFPEQYDFGVNQGLGPPNPQQMTQIPNSYLNNNGSSRFNMGVNKSFGVHTNSNSVHVDRHSHPNKENVKPIEIKFGPILEYDPSKDAKKIQQSQRVSKQPIGTSTFSINTPVSIYKPNKQ